MTRTADPTFHLLVVANETVASEPVRELIQTEASTADARVLVVAPALNSRLAFWLTDNRDARRAAAQRLEACLLPLREAGVHAEGLVADANPLVAIDDALASFPADEILLATHPPGRSHWLERNVVARARARFGVPVHHVVVEAEREMHGAAA